MKKYVKNAVKSALSKPLRGRRYRRLLSISVSALLSISTFLTAIPQTATTVYAAGTGKNLQLGASALAPVLTSVKEEGYDPDVKTRVTTAQTVYYGSSGTQIWCVIGADGTGAVQMADTVTLFAKDNLETGQKYQAAGNSNSYVNSDIKSVVDGYYDSLFTDIEKSQIAERNLYHGEYNDDTERFCDGISDANGEGGAPATKAKLWLLSTKEADLVGLLYREANNYWWLRSPGSPVNNAANVHHTGYVNYYGDIVSDVNDIVGVRPAFNLNLSSIILTSAAEGGKNPGTEGAGTLNEVAEYTGTPWKLTLSDSTRSSFTASAGTGATVSMPEGYTSWTVPVTYSGAKTGSDKEHVSAILTNSSGVAQYYGYIATDSAADTKNVTIPTGLTEGTYTLNVFNEQCNGNYKTDLSSPISTIGLTVTEAQQVATPSYDDKDYITVEKDTTLYAQWKKGKPKHDDDEETEEPSKPAVVSPDTVEGYFAVNGQSVPGVAMGKTVQGVAAQAVFNATRPAGFLQAFTFNMAVNGKVDYTLKNGVLTIIIPKEYQKAGRTFAIMALDKNGKAWTFADTDTNPATVTATINVEGYAFALIYKD